MPRTYTSLGSNYELVTRLSQVIAGMSPECRKAMYCVDRANYVRDKCDAYDDSPQPLILGQTISAPQIHAYALRALQDHLQPGATALDVGCGSGYLTACMAKMVGPTGTVVGIEHHRELVEMSKRNIARDQPGLLESGNVIIVEGDGRMGYPDKANYDAIHVGAAAKEVPRALIEQLKEGGRLVIPVGGFFQELLQIDKNLDGSITRESLVDVSFVPLN